MFLIFFQAWTQLDLYSRVTTPKFVWTRRTPTTLMSFIPTANRSSLAVLASGSQLAMWISIQMEVERRGDANISSLEDCMILFIVSIRKDFDYSYWYTVLSINYPFQPTAVTTKRIAIYVIIVEHTNCLPIRSLRSANSIHFHAKAMKSSRLESVSVVSPNLDSVDSWVIIRISLLEEEVCICWPENRSHFVVCCASYFDYIMLFIIGFNYR